MSHTSLDTFNNPQLKSLVLPETLTIMSDGVRVPARGVRFWMTLFGAGVTMLTSRDSCSLIFPTSEQLMSFKFKYGINVEKGKMLFKHFAISEKAYSATSKERSDLVQLQTPHFKLVHYAKHNYFQIYGPTMCKVFLGKWTQVSFKELPPVENYVGSEKVYFRNIEEALEIIREMRIIWLNAPIKLLRMEEDDAELMDITDADPIFVKLML